DQQKNADGGNALPVAAVGQRNQDRAEKIAAQGEGGGLYGLVKGGDPVEIPDHRKGDQRKEGQENDEEKKSGRKRPG
ncbi:MAG: hypothetical protein II983_03015, partial [Firmicutes bacterium]|nr:hypothetical protein [Bacillota bacterium]